MSPPLGRRTKQELLDCLNKAFDEMFVLDSQGNRCPPVCIVCDRLLKRQHKTRIKAAEFSSVKDVLVTKESSEVPQEIKDCYRPSFPDNAALESAVEDVLLSPRSVALRSTRTGRPDSFLICKECKADLGEGKMPKWAIANGYFFGTPPLCLTELTDVERAFITPVKAFGYIYVWTGGPNQKLKGTLAYYKRQISSIARTACQLDVLGLTEDGIRVVLMGKMTKKQKQRAKEKTQIRPDKIFEAVTWLVQHNREWKDVDLEDLKRKLREPVVITDDQSTEVDGYPQSNLEEEETFRIYFPDAEMDSTRGGQCSATEFIRQAMEAKKNQGGDSATDIEIDAQLSHERVQEYRDSNLMGACLLQYPYGRGGLQSEERFNEDGVIVNPKHQEYIEYLITLSQGHFHRPLFCLILYNYLMKDWLVRTAVIRTRGTANAEAIAEGMEEQDFLDIMRQKEENIPITSEIGRRFVKAIDAVAGAAPHSNQAAYKARKKGETLQHHFGMPSIFFTLTPDDEYQIILDVYSFSDFDKDPSNWMDVMGYSDQDLKEYSEKRVSMRLKFPGLTSWIFEAQVDYIIELVIGWDVNKGCATQRDGFFGKCQAFLGGIEEQGRTTLHIHFLIWILAIQEACNNLHNSRKRKRAEETLCSEIDRFSWCKFIDLQSITELKKVFKCNCEKGHPKKQPEIVPDQQLRNLRCEEGTKADPAYVFCKDCKKKFTAEEVGLEYLTKVIGLRNLQDFPDQRVKRLKTASMVRIQKERKCDRTSEAMFEGAYNFHGHAPTSCFRAKKTPKKKKKKKTATAATASSSSSCPGCSGSSVCDDCRYRLPRPSHCTTIIMDTGVKVKWFKPDGSHTLRDIKENAPKRAKLDVFQNQSVPAVGQSCLAYGNTNIAVLHEGPHMTYTTKYIVKGTQEDDGADFDKIAKIALKASQRMHSVDDIEDGEMTEQERNARNRQEALKRVLAVAFVLHASSVIGAPLAAYLVRNKSRFLISHQTRWCPLDDLESLMLTGNVSHGRYLVKSRAGTYMTNDAFDYLCRPDSQEYECMSAFEFFSTVEVCRSKAKRGEEDRASFINTDKFQHPSYVEEKNEFVACAKKIKDPTKHRLCQIPQYAFPDTAKFGGCIMDGKIINEDTEKYCRRALLLFQPFRSITDLRHNGPITKSYIERNRNREDVTSDERRFMEKLQQGSYTEAYVHCFRSGNASPISQRRCQQFLQNLQDASYNYLRKTNIGDELERKTEQFVVQSDNSENSLPFQEEEVEDEDSSSALQGNMLDELVSLLQQVDSTVTNRMLPRRFSTRRAKEKGRKRCGFETLALMDPNGNQTSTAANLGGQTREDHENNTTDPHNSSNVLRQGQSWLQISEDPEAYRVAAQNQNADFSTSVPSRRDLMNVVIRKRQRVIRTSISSRFGKTTEVIQANGTAESIVEWGEKSKLDPGQRQAFEIITASFVLTFFRDKSCLDYTDANNLEDFEKETKKLEKLADFCGGRRSNQLVALMHGPGGAGKSWVIELVMLYASEYCSFMDDYVFDKRTIVITAMTGCEATLLNGETAHGAFKLNSKKVDAKDEQEWKNTRVAIIDEISFSSKEEVTLLDQKLQLLKGNKERFGVRQHPTAIIFVTPCTPNVRPNPNYFPIHKRVFTSYLWVTSGS